MAGKMNKEAYREMVNEDIQFLVKHAPDTLERRHIVEILRASIESEYDEATGKLIDELDRQLVLEWQSHKLGATRELDLHETRGKIQVWRNARSRR